MIGRHPSFIDKGRRDIVPCDRAARQFPVKMFRRRSAGNRKFSAPAIRHPAREHGLNVPVGLSVISFDNTPIVRFTQPPLTAIDQPIAETVSKAVELIIAAQKGEPLPGEPARIRAPLVERASVARPSGRFGG